MQLAEGVCFDLHGILLDYEPGYEWSWGRFSRKYKLGNLSRQFLNSLKGISLKLVHDEFRSIGLDLPFDEFQAELDLYLREYAPLAKLLPGACELLTSLADRKVPVAIATSGTRSILACMLKPHEIFQRVNFIIAGDDPEVKKGKPAPDIILVAAQKLNLTPEQLICIGDNPGDHLAARAAGVRYSIAMPGPTRSREEFDNPYMFITNLFEFPHNLLAM